MPRQHNRIAVPMEIVLEFSSGKRQGRISDLSVGGCFVDGIAAVQEGDTVFFKLGAESDQWERMSGEVVYVMPGIGFGLRFTDLTLEQNMRLTETVMANSGAA